MAIMAGYGPVVFGSFNFAISLSTLVTTIAAIGNDSLVIKEITSSFEKRGIILGSAFTLRLTVWIITSALYLAYVSFSHFSQEQTLIAIILLPYSLTSLSDVVDSEYQSQLKIQLSAIPRMGVQFIVFIARIYLLLNHYPILIIALSYAIEGVLSFLLIGLVYRKFYKNFQKPRFNKVLFLAIFNKSKPLLAGTVATVLYMRIDQILLEKLSTPFELGQFSMVNRIGEALYFVPVAIAGSYMAKLVKSYLESKEDFSKALRQYMAVMIISGVVCACGIYTAGWLAITYYFGAAYYPAREILLIYAWCILPVAVGLVNNQYFIVKNKEKIVFIRYLMGFVINLALNLVLIPHYGAYGAAVSTLISYVLINFFSNFIFKATFPLFKAQISGIAEIPNLLNSLLKRNFKT